MLARASLIGLLTLLLCASVHAQGGPAPGPASDPADQTDPIPADEPTRNVKSFGNWSIRALPAYNTHILVGEARDARPGELWLQCDRKGLLTVAIPMPDKSKSTGRLRSQTVTMTLDDALPRPMDFIVFANYVAIAMSYESKGEDRVSVFVTALGNARKRFALSYDDTTLDFDVAELPRAKARFLELCKGSPR